MAQLEKFNLTSLLKVLDEKNIFIESVYQYKKVF